MTSPTFADEPAHALRELVRNGRFQDAVDLYRQVAASPLGRRADVTLLGATAATRLGQLGLGSGLAAEALGTFGTRADADGRMRALNLLGAIEFERGRLSEADRYFAEALGLARQLDDTLMAARAANNLASVAYLQGRKDEAAPLYRTALIAYQRLGDRRGMAETYHNLGMIFRQAEEWRNAENVVRQAVRHAELVNDPSLLTLALSGRAELSIARSNFAVARQELERAQQLAAGTGDEIGAAEVQRVDALLALCEGEFDRALKEAEAAHRAAEQHGSALLAAEAAVVAALASKARGNQDMAEQWRRSAASDFHALGATEFLARFEREWETIGE